MKGNPPWHIQAPHRTKDPRTRGHRKGLIKDRRKGPTKDRRTRDRRTRVRRKGPIKDRRTMVRPKGPIQGRRTRDHPKAPIKDRSTNGPIKDPSMGVFRATNTPTGSIVSVHTSSTSLRCLSSASS